MIAFEPPGPGHWRRDESRLTGAITPYMKGLLVDAMKNGLADGWSAYGAPLERMDIRFVAGRMYCRVRPIGAPEEPGDPPPRFVFKMLFWLHPALRRCKKRAALVFEQKRWREAATRWLDETRPA